MAENLFLVPFDYPNFRRTVEHPIFEHKPLPDDVPERVKARDQPRIWGVRDGPRNESVYGRMNPDDALLFYNDGAYRFAGCVGVPFESNEVARRYWGYAPASRCYSVEDFVSISLPRHRLNEFHGYVDDWYPQGVQRVSDERRQNLSNHYGSIAALVRDFATS